MTVRVDMGVDGKGDAVAMDLEELLATRLLVQGNSGSGKSHLLRRLLERSAGHVQQVVIDPEGDFVTLGDKYVVRLGNSSNMEYKFGMLISVLSQLLEGDVGIINVSDGNTAHFSPN